MKILCMVCKTLTGAGLVRKTLKTKLIQFNSDIPYSYMYYHRHPTRGGRGRPPLPFFENQKECPDFGKKCPDCVHPLVKFAIQNVALRVSKRKNSKNFPCGVFFLDFLIKCLSKCPNFTKPPLPLKMSGCAHLPFQFLIMSLKVLRFSLVLT